MDIKLELNENKIINKVNNDKVGLLTSAEWKRQLDPFTPRDTGMLEQTFELRPFEIHYKVPYAQRIYYGKGMNFQHKNPFSTYEWDKKAEEAGKLKNVYRTVNAALQSGRI